MARDNMRVVEVTVEDAEDRHKWRWKIPCGEPRREKPKEAGTACESARLSVGLLIVNDLL